MSKSDSLRNARTLKELAHVIGYQPKALAYILYKIPKNEKYKTFQIPKKNGEQREIQAPTPKLKKLQKRLSDYLYKCIEENLPESERDDSQSLRTRRAISHGFNKRLSIASNASLHENRRYVLNLDLSDFFPSINFGRVRGYFIKNNKFKLDSDIATIIAQIACHDNGLPQGSPCSPVISNLVTQILDIRLTNLAKKYKCTYSRYADDLTFSTNLKCFPCELAVKEEDFRSDWMIGKKLSECIENTGFKINHSKTRVQYKNSRQVVTGLVVNKTVNTKTEYYRYARSMCHSLFQNGIFNLPQYDKRPDISSLETPTINQLEGILNFIFQIKKYKNRFADKGYRKSRIDNKKYPPEDRCSQYENKSHRVSIDGIRNIYNKFLFFKNFYFLKQPLLWCEGKTDIIYLKCAMRQLSKNYPTLIEKSERGTKLKVKFFNHTKTIQEVMNLAEGTSGMTYLMAAYKRLISRYKCQRKNYPVIMLVDNDDGAASIFKTLAEFNPNIKDKSNKIMRTMSYYHVMENLYIVPTPIPNNDSKSKIEDLFDKKLLEMKIEGKTFNSSNENSGDKNQYGKVIFAKKVVIPNQDSINFSNFKNLLTPISDILEIYNIPDNN